MRLYKLFFERTLKTPRKVAILTEKNQMSFEDILHIAEAFEAKILASGIKDGATIGFNANQAELYIVFSLLASKRSYRVIFSSLKGIVESGIEIDAHFTTNLSSDVVSDKRVVIDRQWFAGAGINALPETATLFGEGGSVVYRSSGSTGRAKYVQLSEEYMINRLLTRPDSYGSNSETVRLFSSVSPTLGWSMGGFLKVLVGGGSVLALNDDGTKMLQYIDLYKADALILTPVAVRRIIAVPNAAQYLKTVKHVQLGGAYVSPELLEKFADICDADISVGYGTTEIGGLTTKVYDRDMPPAAGYIGEIYDPNFEIAFFDENYQLLPDANAGVIGVKNSKLIPENAYLGNEQYFDGGGFKDGYFFPGDIMRRENDSLFIQGRIKNIINIGGNKRSLDALQSALEEGLTTELLCCLSVPDEYGLEQLYVYYQAANDVSLTEINEIITAQFGNVRATKALRLEEMPITESNKIDLENLRNLASKDAVSESV